MASTKASREDAPEQAPSISFNQDNTCICIASASGITVYSCETKKIVFTAAIGSLRLCRMLFNTSLLAYVGSGEQPNSSPRKLDLLNTTTNQIIQGIRFTSSVLAVRMNRKRLIVVMERQTVIFALESVEQLSVIETSPNPQGVCALTVDTDPCYLAVPSQTEQGSICVRDAMEGRQVTAELNAHKSPVAVMAWNSDGSLLASASDKGTVIRVHSLPQGNRVYQLRRGSTSAKINSIAFSPSTDVQLLACTSSHRTVHLWNLNPPTTSRTASGYLASVIPTSMSDIVDPQRCLVSLRVPCQMPVECAIKRKQVAGDTEGTSSSVDSNTATLLVVSADAVVYTYQIQNIKNGRTPACQLLDEQAILKGASESVMSL